MTVDAVTAAAAQRPRLLGLAYRLTGSRSEAEDIVQEAYARLSETAEVRDPAAWLTTVTARLAVDHLRSARARREAYVGPWIPEPLVGDADQPESDAVMAESVSTAMQVVLETMSPLERAVFVLHDVFGYRHHEVAAMLDRTPAAVRQIASRARAHLQTRRPRFTADAGQRRQVGAAFVAAANGRDVATLMELLSPDVVFRSDGGGVVAAARKVQVGRARVAAFAGALLDDNPGATFDTAWVNEAPAIRVLGPDGALLSLIVLQVASGQVVEMNAVLNPVKLTNV